METEWRLNLWDKAGMAFLAALAVFTPLAGFESLAIGAAVAAVLLALLVGLWVYAASHRPAGPRRAGPWWLVPVLVALIAVTIAANPPGSTEGWIQTALIALALGCAAMAEVRVRRDTSAGAPV